MLFNPITRKSRKSNKGAKITREVVESAVATYLKNGGKIGSFEEQERNTTLPNDYRDQIDTHSFISGNVGGYGTSINDKFF